MAEKKPKQPKTVMVGYCPECLAHVERPVPCDTAICPYCNPPTEIILNPHVKVIFRFRSDRPPKKEEVVPDK